MKFRLKRQTIRKLWYAAWGAVTVGVIAVALVFSVIRMLLPYAADYKQEIEEKLSTLSEYEVSIKAIEAHWSWFTPQIRLNQIVVSEPVSGVTAYEVEFVKIGVDCIASLMMANVEFSYVDVVGTSISIVRDHESLFIGEREIPLAGGSSVKAFAIPEVLNNKTLRLLGSQVEYRDKVLNLNSQFSDAHVSFRNFDDQRQLFVSLGFPGSLDERFEIAFDLTGRIEDPASWKGNAYARARSIDLEKVVKYFPNLKMFKKGALNFKLWFDWESESVMEVAGEAEILNAYLPAVEHADTDTDIRIDSASMKIYAKRVDGSAVLVVKGLKINREGGQWEPSDMVLTAELDDEHDLRQFQASVDYIRFEDLLPFIERIPYKENGVISKIKSMSPKGEARELFLAWNSNHVFSAVSDFRNLGVTGDASMPSISGLSGRLSINENNGAISLDSEHLSFDMSSIFRQPLTIDRLKGDVHVFRVADEILFASDKVVLEVPEVSIDTRFSVWLGGENGLYMDLSSGFDRAQIRNKSLYLPAGAMSEELLGWLDNAVVDGTLRNAKIEFQGYVAQFPFKDGQGFFKAESDFENGELKYLNDWPRAHGLRGRLTFLNTSMYADVYSAKTYDGEISNVAAVIKDLSAPVLLMDAYAFSSAQDAVRFIRESPLKNIFSSVIEDVEVSGYQGSWLSFSVPMINNSDVQYGGDTALFDMSVALPEFNVYLSELNSQLQFNPDVVRSDESAVVFNRRESVLGIETVPYKKWNNIEFNLRGEYSFSDLLGRYQSPALTRLGGDAIFTVEMKVPFLDVEDKGVPIVSVTSNLKGIKSDMPAPLDKSASASKNFYISNQFLPNGLVELNVHYDYWLKGNLLLEKTRGRDIDILKGELRAGNGYPRIPKETGIQLTGSFGRLDLDGWFNMRDQFSDPDAEDTLISKLSKVQITVDDVLYLGAHFKPAIISSEKDANGWLVNVDSPIMRGDVRIAESSLMKEGLGINLQYLNVDAFGEDGDGAVDPRTIPPIKFFSEKLDYQDWKLSRVSFVSAPFVKGLRIHSLTVGDPTLNVRADGEWTQSGMGLQQTNLHIVVDTENLGEGITKIGYSDFIKDGKGSAEFNIKWPASPAGFAYEILQGSANLAFLKGQILDVDPGAGGRVFSLISLQTLPRRLALDFNDVFSKGFRFDSASGDFIFSAGDAFTNNFVIDGPAARMSVKGRTGLVQKDYDQSVIVATEFSATLPVIGAILGGATGGLAGILVDGISKLLGKQSDEQGTHYTIKGPWDDPVIEKIKKQKKRKQLDKKQSS